MQNSGPCDEKDDHGEDLLGAEILPARSRPVAIPSRVGEPRLCRIDATV